MVALTLPLWHIDAEREWGRPSHCKWTFGRNGTGRVPSTPHNSVPPRRGTCVPYNRHLEHVGVNLAPLRLAAVTRTEYTAHHQAHRHSSAVRVPTLRSQQGRNSVVSLSGRAPSSSNRKMSSPSDLLDTVRSGLCRLTFGSLCTNIRASATMLGYACGNGRRRSTDHQHGRSCSTPLRKSLVGRNVRVSSL